MTDSERVAIFWDLENCSVPSTASGCAVAGNISSLTQPFGSIRLFRAYLENDPSPSSKSLELRSELQSSGVSLVDCPHNGRKDVADKMILVDMMAYAIDTPAPSTIVLITGDRDFAYAVSTLKLRRYRVILITLSNAHTTLRHQASLCFDWVKDVVNPSMNQSSQTLGQPSGHIVSPVPTTPESSASLESESSSVPVDPDQSPSTPHASSSSQSSGSPCYHPVPLKFLPLVTVLESHWEEGRYQPLRSKVAVDLVKENNRVYQNAGVNTFREYVSMAENEGVVILGGVGGHAWVQLSFAFLP